MSTDEAITDWSGCSIDYSEYIKICVYSICLLIQLIITVISIKGVNKLTDIFKEIKYIYYINVISSNLYIIINIFRRIGCIISYKYITINLYPISAFLYSIVLLCLLLILWIRLQRSFDRSIFSISKNKSIIFIILFIFMCITAILYSIIRILIVRKISDDEQPGLQMYITNIIGANGLILYFVTSIYTTSVFANNLFKLMALRQASLSLGFDTNKITLNQHQNQIIDQVSRLSTLLSLAIFTTFLSSIAFVSYAFNENDKYKDGLTQIFSITLFDIIINNICLYLQFSFGKPYYDKYCKCFQLCCKFMFTAKVKKLMIQRYESQAKSIHLTECHQRHAITANTPSSVQSKQEKNVNLNVDVAQIVDKDTNLPPLPKMNTLTPSSLAEQDSLKIEGRDLTVEVIDNMNNVNCVELDKKRSASDDD